MCSVKELILEERRAKVHPSSDIFVVKGARGGGEGFKTLLKVMGNHGYPFYSSIRKGRIQGPKGLIKGDSIVIVKVNSQWNERGGTNTDLVKEIIDAVLDHPDGFEGEVVVADNGQAQFGAHGHGGSLDYENNNARDTTQSIQDVVDAFSDVQRVSTYLWDQITTKAVSEYSEGDMDDGYIVDETHNPKTGIKVSYPKFKTQFGTLVSFKHGIWDSEKKVYDEDRLKVINVPVLKAHFIYGVTACVKHYMGVVSDKLTGGSSHRSVSSGGMGTAIAETRLPTLNVLDAIWVNASPGKGPRTLYKDATRIDTLLAGTDLIALDYFAAKYVLMQTARLNGHKDLYKIDPDNSEPGSFGDWLRLSMREISKAGYDATTDEDAMNVYIVNL